MASQDGDNLFLVRGGRQGGHPAGAPSDREPQRGIERPLAAGLLHGQLCPAGRLPGGSSVNFDAPVTLGKFAHIFREEIGGNFASKDVGRICGGRRQLRGVGCSKTAHNQRPNSW